MEKLTAILKTKNKTDQELLASGGMVTKKDLPWLRSCMDAWHGIVVEVTAYHLEVTKEEDPWLRYNMVGWDELDSETDSRVKEAMYIMEQDPVFGTYYNDRERFEADWQKGKYEPGAGISFEASDVVILKENNAQKLGRLITAHTDLPIITMVEAEIIGDDSGRWCGAVGTCRISEFVYSEHGCCDGERIFWKHDADDLAALMAENEEGDYEVALVNAWTKVNAMPWKKAIVLNIDLPEDL